MNSKRSIRLFLFVAVVGVAAMFFAGYACGSYRMARSLTEQDAQYTKNETNKQKSTEDVGYVSEGGTWDALNPDGTSAAEWNKYKKFPVSEVRRCIRAGILLSERYRGISDGI